MMVVNVVRRLELHSRRYPKARLSIGEDRSGVIDAKSKHGRK